MKKEKEQVMLSVIIQDIGIKPICIHTYMYIYICICMYVYMCINTEKFNKIHSMI